MQDAKLPALMTVKEKALPNNATIHSEEYTLNNTLGRLQLTGTVNKILTLADDHSLNVTVQYKEGTKWHDLATVFSATSGKTIPAGTLFEFIPPPSNTRRVCRLAVTTNFDTAAVEILP